MTRNEQRGLEPYGYVFQHEETGLQQVVDVQQVEWGFEGNNPRRQMIGPVYFHKPSAGAPSPLAQLMGLTADQLCRSPLIEWLVPTTEEWNACEVMQDRYDLMKKRVRLAFTDAALATATEGSGE